jgi:VWFA-related protein
MNRIAIIVSLICLALGVAVTTAQENPFKTQNPFETSGERPIRLLGGEEPPPALPLPDSGETVLWSAVVQGKSGPQDGLGRDDFTLAVDGKGRDISWFARRPAGEDADDPPVWYVALFDLTIGDPQMMKQAGEQLVAAMGSKLVAGQRVALVIFDGQMDVVVPFTDDPAKVSAALARLPGRSVFSIHDFFGKRVRVSARGELRIKSTLDKSDDMAQHNFAANRFFTEMRRLALELGELPGRKQVMLFSGGFNRRWLAKEEVAFLRMVDAFCRATAAVYSYHAVDDEYLDRVLEAEGIRRAKQEKAGPSELKHAERLIRSLAETSGGRAWTGKEGLDEIVRVLVEEGRHHYLFGFPRGDGERGGLFLPCEVKSTGGAAVRAPLGFYDN